MGPCYYEQTLRKANMSQYHCGRANERDSMRQVKKPIHKRAYKAKIGHRNGDWRVKYSGRLNDGD